MKKRLIFFMALIIMMLLALANAQPTAISINQTSGNYYKDTFTFSASTTGTSPFVAFYYATTGSSNGTFTEIGVDNRSGTTFNATLNTASLSSGSYVIFVSNDTLIPSNDTVSGEVNASITVQFDNTDPSCKLVLTPYKISPFKMVELDCSQSSDGNLNTSRYILSITDSDGVATSDTDETDGIAEFNEDKTSVLGEYTARCSVSDYANNTATCTDTLFVSSDAKEGVTKAETGEDEVKAKSKNTIMIGGIFLLLFVMVIAVLVIIMLMKKTKKRKK